MVRIKTRRKIGYNFSKSSNWNIKKGLSVLKNEYHIKSKKHRLLLIGKELEVRAIQYKNDNPELSMRVAKMAHKAYTLYDTLE